MKFDSYTRFLKSPLYQECILAEVEGRPLPDAQQVPSSPASKHSASSDHSNTSTPKKVPVPRAGLPSEGALQTADVPVGVFSHSQNLKGALWLCSRGSGRGGRAPAAGLEGLAGLHLPRQPRLGVPPRFPSPVSPETAQQHHTVLIVLSL